MTVKINETFDESQTKWIKDVEFEAGKIDILVRLPSYDHRISDYAKLNNIEAGDQMRGVAKCFKLRVEQSIIGWDGVLDQSEQPIKFTHDLFCKLCGRYQKLFEWTRREIGKLYDLPTPADYLGN